MAAMIRPAMVLQMDLDEEGYSEDVVAELKRSYAYVASPLVTSHQVGEDGIHNIIRFLVKIRKPYWHSSDEGADELWSDVVRTWLANMLTKTSTTMVSFNKNREEKDEEPLVFNILEIELEDTIVTIQLNDDSSVPETAISIVEEARAQANS